MKVVFLESVEGTAQVGEVKEVKNGFARNYLLPKRLAAPAVEPYLQRANARAKREAKRQEALDQDAAAVAARIEGSKISLSVRVGEHGKLYGSVTSIHIAAEVAKLLSEEQFDHRKVLLPEAIKEIGVQPIRLRLTRNVEATIELEVLAEGEPEIPFDPEASVEDAEAAPEDTAGDPPEATVDSEESDTEQPPLEEEEDVSSEAEVVNAEAEAGDGAGDDEDR